MKSFPMKISLMQIIALSRLPLVIAVTGLAVMLGMPLLASAQVTENETLPIEIRMLHMKMLGQKPDFQKILYSNPEFSANRHKFGQEALLNQQINLLRKLYDDAGPEKPIYIDKRMPVTKMSSRSRTIILEPIPIDKPILFQTNDQEEYYGVFIRNGDVMQKLITPFDFDDFISLEAAYLQQRGQINTHLVLSPIAADAKPFILDNGQEVNVILADITELKLLDDRDKKLLLHKRFDDNNGLPVPTPVVPNNRDYMPLPPATDE